MIPQEGDIYRFTLQGLPRPEVRHYLVIGEAGFYYKAKEYFAIHLETGKIKNDLLFTEDYIRLYGVEKVE